MVFVCVFHGRVRLYLYVCLSLFFFYVCLPLAVREISRLCHFSMFRDLYLGW